ncbi:MAG TPA: DUF222 domain-containing protein [Acidimicrobiia bacterium]
MRWFEASADEIDQGFGQFAGLQAAAQAELCRLVQAADVSQVWMRDGARSMVEWAGLRLRVRVETAGLLVRVARRLADLPRLSEAFSAGELSLDQVDALSRMATPVTEAGLIDEALGLSNEGLDRLARRSRPPSAGDERSVWDRRALWLQWNLDESELRLRGQLPGAHGEIVQEALESVADRFGPNPETGLFDPYSMQLADALVEMSATAGEGGSPPQISLHAELEALTTPDRGVIELAHGGLVPNQTARRLGCDGVVETVVHEDNVIVGVGRNSRIVPGWLRRQLEYRDCGICRFPGCGNTRWLQAHHIQHWADGGPTDLDNLILLCGHHHRYLHEHRWHITGTPNTQVVFRRPDWQPYPQTRARLDPRLAALTHRST